jgi:hypothetical protein
MADLLIRNIEPALKRQIEEHARINKRSLSDEAKRLLLRGLAAPEDTRGLGTLMFESIRPEDRGDDLVFEYKGDFPKPPEFE